MKTENLKELRELRMQEKALKAQLETVLPLAKDEALAILAEQGLEKGKFTVDEVGQFVLDVAPVYDLSDYRRYKEPEAKEWRCARREQRAARTMASSFTASMRTLMNNFIKLYGTAKQPDSIDYTLKCLGLD